MRAFLYAIIAGYTYDKGEAPVSCLTSDTDATYNMKHVRGDTFISSDFYFTNEEVPEGTTYQEFLDGILDGTYTLQDLSQYTIKGQIRTSHDNVVFIDFSQWIVTEDNILKWSIPASETENSDLLLYQARYDIEFTHIVSGEVNTPISGSYKMLRDYTHE